MVSDNKIKGPKVWPLTVGVLLMMLGWLTLALEQEANEKVGPGWGIPIMLVGLGFIGYFIYLYKKA